MKWSRQWSQRLRIVGGVVLGIMLLGVRPVAATDYFLTIGGGYDPSGNQASLEANVLFYQRLLSEQHRQPRRHAVFFADGRDPEADLQVLVDQAPRKRLPATELLATLHRQDGDVVTYRNHRVRDVAGPLDPDLIRAELESLSRTARRGDRVIIYVTAHGSEGAEDDAFNTTIDCWNEREITARDFAAWMDKLPPDVPVVMVMAQCYCGGFARTIFHELSEDEGLSPQLRVGFFAQQHDLPAAGCRPDIEHDEEFSSYFWGAVAGRTRNGVPIAGCDLDNNGVVSFAEAYAHAVVASETIDIPLRASDALLRSYSRVHIDDADGDAKAATASRLTGRLQEYVDEAGPISRRIITQLAATLEFDLDDEVAVVTADVERTRRSLRRGRGPRQSSGRRELLRQVADKWPELADPRRWEDSPLLAPDQQEQLFADLQGLPGWNEYEQRRRQRQAAAKQTEQAELRTAKLRRLLQTLETVALERNLPHLAPPEIVERYRQMIALERSSLNPVPRTRTPQ